MYLVNWKDLPADEVHVPRRLEGFPSSRQGTCTSPAGRISFRPTRYMYLADWKGFLPVDEVRVPRRQEGFPSGQRGTCTSPAGRKPFQPAISSFRPRVSLGIPGYPPGFHGKGASAPESAPASGYPLALAGIRQRIADIRSGLSPPISTTNTNRGHRGRTEEGLNADPNGHGDDLVDPDLDEEMDEGNPGPDHESLPDDEAIYNYEAWPPLPSASPNERPIQELNALLQLDEAHTDLLHRLLQVALLSRFSGRLARPPAVVEPAMVMPHRFSSTIKTLIRGRIRELLTRDNLEAYSRTQTVAGLPIHHTPLVSLTAYLEALPAEIKQEHLPEGWPLNHLASQGVLAMMRTLLKHERGALRNLLLTNIKEFNRRLIDGPVPSLMQLVMIIDRAMGGRDEMRMREAIRQAYNATTIIHLGYLRLEVVQHYLNPDPTSSLTQWDIIDRKLEHVRRQSDIYKNVLVILDLHPFKTLGITGSI
ncbi:hypothetical protein PGTUg99_025367 [Puccinia graminis f. sp. tritici]|uniref:Uncharacterized protein n=1 Tax=Puccinia graminis f. sp. tritici TaxID=56615 RepID=A0A5B0MZ72_PUCGR|nr:hypothetical protein PGTUg99_025367 [Puccinia graminis f. sp. tritici]